MIPGIQEIKSLAIKYSKKQLANMAQMGLIDPQKAVMAGMMRDRIAKEDMQPPSTTVAQDVLGMSPQPQMGMQPQPQMVQAQPQMGAPVEQPPVMAASGGLTNLPVEVQDYAGGGIVAFADGGDIDRDGQGVPRFQGGGPLMFPEDSLFGRLQRGSFFSEAAPDSLLGRLQRRYQNDPEVQKQIEEEKLRQAQAAEAASALRKSENRPQTTAAPTTTTSAPEFKDARQAPPPAPSAKREAGPAGGPRGPAAPAAPGLKRPDPAGYLPDLTGFKPEEFSARAALGLSDIGKERVDYMRLMGIDPDMYSKMIGKEEAKRGELAKRKEVAKGEALMEAGLGLIGARRGQEFQALGEAGRRGLAGLREANRELRASEEKLEDRINAFRIADQQAKQSGAEKDLAKRDSELNRVEAAQREAVKDRNTFTAEKAKLGMEGAKIRTQGELSLYNTDVQAQLERQKIAIQQQQAANQAAYYQKSLALTEARIKSMDAASQARMLKARQESDKMFEGSQEYGALIKQLKRDYGDNYLTADKAKVALQKAKDIFFAQQLEGMGALTPGYVDHSSL